MAPMSRDPSCASLTTASCAQSRVGNGDDGHVLDRRVAVKDILPPDHDGDVFAAADDDVLGAPGQGDETIRVHHSAITRSQPAVDERLLGEVGPGIVAGEQSGAGDLEIPLGARRDFLVHLIDDPRLGARDDHAVRSVDAVGGEVGRGGDPDAVLGHAPGRTDEAPEQITRVWQERARDGTRQRRSW